MAAASYASRHLVRTGRPEGGSGALTDSIRNSALFNRVLVREGADFILRVAIVELEQSPATGFSMTAGMEARWTLSRTDTGSLVWSDTIHSSYTVSAISSRKAVTRMKLATEGAAKENIRQGMDRISRIEPTRLQRGSDKP